MKADVSLYLDTRRALKDGRFPLKLHLYFPPRNEKLFALDYNLSKEDFKFAYLSKRPKKEYQELRIELDAIVSKAFEIVKDLGSFITVEKFERKLFGSTINTMNVIEHFEAKRSELEKNEQIGTAASYDCSIKSLISFFSDGKKNPITFLAFSILTPEKLNKYEKWMISRDNSKTTVGIYMRNLRHIFNNAINEGAVHPELYPFKKYKIPTGRNIKKALEVDELKALYTADVRDPFIEKARDYWFFSYQCNGMNFRDIAELRFKNIHSTYFSFLRHKTQNTTKEDPVPIVVPITEHITRFIEKYGVSKRSGNDFVFPIFSLGMSAKEKLRANQNFIRFVNQHMQRLVVKLGLSIRLGTMVARHSFTTKVTRTMGLEFAQEALGHTTMNTTQNYWKGFEKTAKKEMAEKLMDFI